MRSTRTSMFYFLILSTYSRSRNQDHKKHDGKHKIGCMFATHILHIYTCKQKQYIFIVFTHSLTTKQPLPFARFGYYLHLALVHLLNDNVSFFFFVSIFCFTFPSAYFPFAPLFFAIPLDLTDWSLMYSFTRIFLTVFILDSAIIELRIEKTVMFCDSFVHFNKLLFVWLCVIVCVYWTW